MNGRERGEIRRKWKRQRLIGVGKENKKGRRRETEKRRGREQIVKGSKHSGALLLIQAVSTRKENHLCFYSELSTGGEVLGLMTVCV
jgi:hypothetical protein